MLIKTKIYLSLLSAMLIIVILGLGIYQTISNINQDNSIRTLISELALKIYERNIVAADYILYPSERAKIQWQIRHEQIGEILNRIITQNSLYNERLAALLNSQDKLSQDFLSLTERYKLQVDVSYDEQEIYKVFLEEIKKGVTTKDWPVKFVDFLSTQNEQILLNQTLLGRLVAGILVEAQSMASNSFLLLGDVNYSIQRAQNKAYVLGGVITVLLFSVIGMLFLIFYRGVFKNILKLFSGVNKIAAGYYGYKLNIKRNDEIGKLGKAFDDMSETIKLERKKLAEQSKVMLQNHLDLEEREAAILNVLEDVEVEKHKSDILADDLQKFKLAVKKSSDHIVITDPGGKIIDANEAAERITGYTFEQMRGKTPALWGKQMPKEFYKSMWHIIKEKKQPFHGEITNRRVDGQTYISEVDIIPILGLNKQILYFVGIERDVTKEKNIDRAKTEFVSLASHQLRTPLTAVNWYSEMLLNRRSGKLNPVQEKYIETIYDSNLRMINLVNSLLNVSRIEMGTLIIEPERTDIRQIVNSIIVDLGYKIKLKQINLLKRYDKSLPRAVMVDQQIVRIIIQNLLSNAVKYSHDKGNVELYVGVKKNNILIKVVDNGYGITKNQQNQIFTKLFRADNVKQKDTDGTGLGLYIVKSILDEVGGRVWFESIENKGSTFYVTFPKKGMKLKEGTKRLEEVDV
ncbi:MAG: PAS/PAC sensor signal transduction histidine kinase [Candidatus Magasanikbacteria bacterium GW2011_GWA2_37_8]|uniref:histidine kinase n=1 Tax=Candidatus Magasanikbacteria bacterium GW2011_GWA2_37_8 TaxID=1619036 RepID=A0A0G0JVH7_9BACT|nr:MAG: PAS/PAC sensor signal transduction histidine kinase [Candidatus Magasanikbacteria bacterium GW2011_GWA2_37_8]